MATIRSAPLPKPEKAPVHKFALCAGIIAHAGALLAFVPAFFDWWAVLGCFALMYFTGAIGISATYHRLLTHRSYSVRPRWFEYVLTIIGNLTMQGGASAGSPIIAATTLTPTSRSTSTRRGTASGGRTSSG